MRISRVGVVCLVILGAVAALYSYVSYLLHGSTLEVIWVAYMLGEGTRLRDIVPPELLVTLVALSVLLFKRRAVSNQLETLLTVPPLLDLVYILSAAYTIMRSPRGNTKELIRRVRSRQTTPVLTRGISADRRLSLQQFVCTLTHTAEGIVQHPLRDGSISRLRGVCLYNITKRLKAPKGVVAIETGAAGGRISRYILQALNENAGGLLVSIDLPDFKSEYYGAPKGSPVGYLVPKELRGRWELVLEDSRTSLPEISKAHKVDLFVHDSLHTYDHMMFEMETVWPHINSGGVLLVHDAGKAFVDFAQKVGRPYWVWERYGGIVK